MKVRKIRSLVEYGTETDEDILDLPDGWDDWTEKQQDDFLTECAVTHQNNVAPCGAEVVEVEE